MDYGTTTITVVSHLVNVVEADKSGWIESLWDKHERREKTGGGGVDIAFVCNYPNVNAIWPKCNIIYVDGSNKLTIILLQSIFWMTKCYKWYVLCHGNARTFPETLSCTSGREKDVGMRWDE